MDLAERPYAMLAELTYRCPLHCLTAQILSDQQNRVNSIQSSGNELFEKQ